MVHQGLRERLRAPAGWEELARLVFSYEESLQRSKAELHASVEACERANAGELRAFEADRGAYMKQHEGSTVATVPSCAVAGAQMVLLLNKDKAAQLGAQAGVTLVCRYVCIFYSPQAKPTCLPLFL